VLRHGDTVLGGAWKRGWQPADLVRMVRRNMETGHVRLAVDLVAAEARRYAPASLEPRWADQLADLEAAVWWEDDADFLTKIGVRESGGRFDTATRVLELLRMLSRLPVIAPAGPPPGVRRPARKGAPAHGDHRMLGRIRALLAKAESTEFTEEADALTAKAQQLMTRHSIDEALIAADGGDPNGPDAFRIGIDNPYEQAKAMLLDAVAEANRARMVWSSPYGFATVVGFESDLESVELLYTSLLVQATTAMNRAGVKQDKKGKSKTRSFRQTFLIAYAGRIRERLTVATEQAVHDAAEGVAEEGVQHVEPDARLLPVLAAREVAVGETTDRMFPGATRAKMRMQWNQEGWEHGTAAADRAVLGRTSGELKSRS
jgi:hypothetical protein